MSDDGVLGVNGRLVPAGAPALDPRDRGFALGDGLFETMRARAGVIPWIDRHLARLRTGAAVLSIPLPWTDAELVAHIEEVLQANRLAAAAVRLTVSRGVPSRRGLLPEPGATPSLVVHAQPFPGYPAELHRRGMRVVTSRVRRNEHSPLAAIKSLSYLDQVLARQEAAAPGADEALLWNTAGDLVCASAANLFLIRDGRLLTPSVTSGALPGIARGLVLTEIAPRLGLAVAEQAVQPAEMGEAEEAFLTSALLGVMPLVAVDRVPIGRGRPGAVTRRLAKTLATWSDERSWR